MSLFPPWRGHKSFIVHLTGNVAGSLASFALALLTTPIMTRIFSPDAYGAYGILGSCALVVVGLTLLGLPNALSQERSKRRRLEIGASITAIMALLVCMTLGACIGLAIVQVKPSWAAGLFPALWLLPLLIAVTAAVGVAEAVCVVDKRFSAMAGLRLANTAVARLSTISLGVLISPTSATMVLGDAAGKLAQCWILAKQADPRRLLRLGFRRGLLMSVVYRYRDFAMYGSVAGVIPTALVAVCGTIISNHFDLQGAGHFLFARSIVNIPVALIALPIAPVIYRRYIDVERESPDKLYRLVIKITLFGILIGIMALTPVWAFGGDIFSVLFGARWRTAGVLASILSVVQVFEMSFVLIQSAFRVTRRLRFLLVVESSTAFAVVLAFSLVPYGGLLGAVETLTLLLIARLGILHAACFQAVRSSWSS